MGHVLTLESFETKNDGFGLHFDAGPTADFAAGRAEGYENGLQEAALRQDALSNELVQTIADMSFGYAEARLQLLRSLGPLFETIIERLIPETIATAFPAHIAAQLNAAAKVDTAAPLTLTVHPDQIAAVSKILPVSMDMALTIDSDPNLSPNAAWIASPHMETALDLDGLVVDLSSTLSTLFDEIKGHISHG